MASLSPHVPPPPVVSHRVYDDSRRHYANAVCEALAAMGAPAMARELVRRNLRAAVSSDANWCIYRTWCEHYLAEWQKELQKPEKAKGMAALPPPPRPPRSMDEAYAWLLRGRDVAPEDMRRLIHEDDAAKEKEARERREAEWPIGDWGCSYLGGEATPPLPGE